ncbi:MAG: murein L,D-transpeptidase catalytic domain-containing protein [Bdellovibrionales bacterium]
MTAFKWLQGLAMIALTSVHVPSFAQFADEVEEGFDRQSEEEILRAESEIQALFGPDSIPHFRSVEDEYRVLQKYNHLDPKHWVPSNLLKEAVLYFDKNKSKFPNKAYLTIVDFKPRSDRYRFFLINMDTGKVERYRTTHGIGSDTDNDGRAERFGNENGSGKSSLGFVRTAEVYWGKYRRSVRLDGLSSTNSNIRRRAIVFHGWDNVKEAPVIQGRSWGCITLDWDIKDKVLDKVKEGSLMYVGLGK